SLNESIALYLPGPTIAKEALQLSKEAVLESAQALADAEVRRHRVIIWGNFSKKSSPMAMSHHILANVLKVDNIPGLKATWLVKKGSNSTKGILVTLPEGITPAEVVDKRQHIKKICRLVSGVSRDKTLAERNKCSSPQNFRYDQLQMEPIVVLNDLKHSTHGQQNKNSYSASTVDIDSPISKLNPEVPAIPPTLPIIKRSPLGLLGSAPLALAQTNRSKSHHHFRLGQIQTRPPE
ncbi:MAG: hypothetical protein ABW094_09870, partial [Candidatus Thiodiazotropha sp.]